MSANKINTIYLATDHAGFEYKEYVKQFLNSHYNDINVIDFGATEYHVSDNYTEYIHKAGYALRYDIENNYDKSNSSRAIVFGGSGEGEAIVMNRYDGVRCTTYYGGELQIIELGRKHNDANALSIGARFVYQKELKQIVNLFLNTEFESGRHQFRVDNIDKLL